MKKLIAVATTLGALLAFSAFAAESSDYELVYNALKTKATKQSTNAGVAQYSKIISRLACMKSVSLESGATVNVDCFMDTSMDGDDELVMKADATIFDSLKIKAMTVSTNAGVVQLNKTVGPLSCDYYYSVESGAMTYASCDLQ